MTIAVEKVLYTARATADGGRDGKVATDDGKLAVTVAPPVEMGGNGNGTNPEQLFAAGYAACFGSAVARVARKQRKDPGEVRIDANVRIGAIPGGGFGLAVALVAHVPGVSREEAEAIVAAAHQVCPYSNATRGNIEVTISVA